MTVPGFGFWVSGFGGGCGLDPNGMVSGMATSKITVTLKDEQVDEIRKLVAAGEAANISAFVQHAVHLALHDAAGWQQLLDNAIAQTGGPLTKEERSWADGILGHQEGKKLPRKRKAA